MSMSLQKYHTCWQQAMQQLNLSEIADESCVIFESSHSTPMGEGMTALPDFGGAICYYRYYRVSDELRPREPQTHSSDLGYLPGLPMWVQSWERRRPKLSEDEIQTCHDAAIRDLDALLEEFARLGYQSEMKKRLKQIVNYAFVEFELDEVYILPRDLEELLSSLGNPLADYEVYENDEEAEARAPAFDLSNHKHREALKERIYMVDR